MENRAVYSTVYLYNIELIMKCFDLIHHFFLDKLNLVARIRREFMSVHYEKACTRILFSDFSICHSCTPLRGCPSIITQLICNMFLDLCVVRFENLSQKPYLQNICSASGFFANSRA